MEKYMAEEDWYLKYIEMVRRSIFNRQMMSWSAVHWISCRSPCWLHGMLDYALRVLPYFVMIAMLGLADIQLPSIVLLARQRVA